MRTNFEHFASLFHEQLKRPKSYDHGYLFQDSVVTEKC